jgi:hypothetical protein
MPVSFHHIRRWRNMVQISWNHHLTWWKGRKNMKWNKCWTQGDMGMERSYNISLNREGIPRVMTVGSLQNKCMCQNWWIGFTEKTLKPSGQFA